VTMSVLSTLDALTPARLVGLGLVIGVGIAFFNPAWHAIVPSLVPASLVPGAVSLNSASGGVATALGPALGGLLLATAGAAFSFGVAAVGYLAIAVAVAATRADDLDQEKGSLVVAIAAGVRYLRFSRGYLWLLLLGSLFGFASASLRSMLPNLTSDTLGGGSVMYGVLLGLFGCGATVGAVTRSHASRRLGPSLLPICIVAFGLTGVVIGLSNLVPLTAMFVTIAGVLWTWILATLNSTYQVLTPDWVRGRTMGAFTLSVFGFVPLGALASGALGTSIGADKALMTFSGAVVAIGVLSFRMPIPVLERIEPPVVLERDPSTIPDVEASNEPVLVITTWHVDPSDLETFLQVLSDLRRVRLRTGATQWAAYRDATDPTTISEVFMLPSWEQRVQQIRRLDTVAMQVIRRADELGSAETRVRRNLVGFDVDSELKGRDQTFEVPDYPSPGLFRRRDK
jgi:MFS family permease